MTRRALSKLLATPAARFLVLGALLVAVDRGFLRDATEDPSGRDVIEVSAGRVAELRDGWIERVGALPDGAALQRLIDAEIDDEVLVREARARGLLARDPVVRARLARNVGFIEGEEEARARAGETGRVTAALALGLERSDLVVRRRMIERMRAELVAGAARPPGAGEIASRFARDRASLAGAARVRLSHVFLSGERRGDRLERDALRLRAQVEAETLDPDSAVARGDAFLLGHALSSRSQSELAQVFGAEFARRVFALAPGSWSEPIASGYGLHLVLVHERLAASPAELSSARAQISAQLRHEREAVALRDALDSLRARYEIRVAGEGR